MDGRPPTTPLDSHSTIDAFLSALAAKEPTPGGGAVAALAGALAAAMGEMVLNFSVDKRDLAQHRGQLAAILHEMHNARRMLLQLMVEDQLAYAALTAAKKSQKSPPNPRDPAHDAALLACIRVPQTIGATAIAILRAAQQATPIANRHLLSDLAVCAELAMATLRCAVYNVRVNLGEVADPAERLDLRSSTQKMLGSGTDLIRQLMPAIWQRIDQSAAEKSAAKK
jgi:formiminotetrahydrofolate cyclodeaminase